MDITASQLRFGMQHQAETLHSRSETLRVVRNPLEQASDTNAARAEAQQLRISEQGRALAASVPSALEALEGRQTTAIDAAADAELSDDPQLGLLARMIEAITGRAVRIFDASELRTQATSSTSSVRATSQGEQTSASVARGDVALEYRAVEHYRESERTQVQIEGVIETADGESIRFALNLDMQRHYAESSETRIDLRPAQQRKDPLVVNFSGTAAQLRDARFQFDIDADGETDSLAQLASGSGFLALDRNADGRINDGNELFGALSGDGFADLAQLDSDQDGWVDAADPAFAQLRVWIPDAHGDGHLATLDELGIGALSTRSIASAFALRGEGNSDLGQVRSTGLYVGADRSVGSVQQIDLSV